MKRITLLTHYLCFMCTFSIFATQTEIQNTVVKFPSNQLTVEEFFENIEEQSNFLVVFSNSEIDVKQTIALKSKSAKISDILDESSDKLGIIYKIENKYIILSKKNEQPAVKQSNVTVTGRILDQSGDPMVGVNITVKGQSSIGTISDMDGNFTLTVPAANSILSVSYVGYIAQEVTASDRPMRIVLVEDTKMLDELVVIGYGIVKKSDVTGSVSSVKADDLNKMATFSPVAALQGRAAGVTVIQESGSPDAVASIKIRGVGTTNDSSPLYVVDGFPMSDINYLNPSDIESIEILKDASACAIYGSRGANGVVLVTTKKGSSGPLKVDVKAYYGIESMGTKPRMLNSSQYAQLSNEAYINAGLDPLYSSTTNLPYNTNWFDEVSHLGQFQNYNITFSGGGERMSSLLSANYYKKEGIIKSTNFERLSFSQNNVMKAADFLTITSSFSGAFTTSKRLDPTSIFLSSLIAPPDIPVVDPSTNYFSGISKIRIENPAGRIDRNNTTNRRTYLIGNFNAELKLLKDLTFSSRFGIKYDGKYNDGFSPVYYETMDNSEAVNTVSRETTRMIDWSWENILTYNKNFGGDHDLTVMAAISAREYKYDEYKVTKQNIPIEKEEYWYFNSATDNPLAEGLGYSLAMLSYLGRINYSFKDRYLITASIRADGSSRFIGSNRWGVFPSAAVAWKLSEEPFFKNMDLDWFNTVKIRAGYGEIGNENITSYYPYLTAVTQRHYYTLGSGQARINGSAPNRLGNPDAKWETSTQANVGLDLMFLDGKIEFTADYYIRKTNDILLTQQIPTISGSSSMVRNVGGMENKGFEFSVAYKETRRVFSYQVGANMAFVKNKVTDLGTSGSLVAGFPYDYSLIDFQGALGNMIRSEVGLPYGQFYGYQIEKVFQTQAEIDAYVKDGNLIQPDAQPGDFMFKDLNDNGRIDEGDMTFIGNPIPDVTFGLSFDATWKNFDLSLLFQGVIGNDIYNASKYYFMRFDGRQNVRTEYLDKYWTGPGSTDEYPIVTNDLTRNSLNFRNSDFYVEKGSYIRLKTVQLGYNVSPSRFVGNMKPSFRFYVSAQNLFTITGYGGFDPEVSDISVDRGQYPQSRSFIVGTVINF